jgi:ElaB/YqjD/DUF883 family membrane-anchored ribosome-binding protein
LRWRRQNVFSFQLFSRQHSSEGKPMNDTSRKTEAAADDISADIANLRADVAKLSASMTELLRHQATHAQDRVMDAVGSAREQLASSAADATEKMRSASAELESSIERNPLAAVVIALICGLLLGRIGRD